MTSREFYQLLDRCLESECRRLGFSRKRGTVSLWSVDLPAGTFFYELSKKPKEPYLPYIGGRFNVRCDLTPSADPKLRDLNSSISYMEYFADSDLVGLRELQDRVLCKIVDQEPPSKFDRLMLAAQAPSLRREIGSTFNRHQVFTLPYLDTEDVLAWGGFLASRLEQTLKGVRNKPVFFMRVEGGQPGAPPNGGPAKPVGNSGVTEGPPSMS